MLMITEVVWIIKSLKKSLDLDVTSRFTMDTQEVKNDEDQ